MTRGRAMRRAGAEAAGAGGARPKAPSGGALGAHGSRGGRGSGGGAQPLPPEPPARPPASGKPGASDPPSATEGLDLVPDGFSVRVRLEETGETFRMANCHSDMTVRELKEDLDLMVGIPFNLQRLQYLDQGDLMDDTTLKLHAVVPGAILSLCIWHYDGWTDLVLASVEGDPSKLSCLGITEDSFYRTANSKHFEDEKWKRWVAQRAFVALYVTSHRGHFDAVQFLLEHGANCLSKTPVGRTALHAAAAMGRLDCITVLMEHGASIHDRDARGESPIVVARRLQRRQSERRMFLLYWMARTGAKDCRDLTVKQLLRRVISGSGLPRRPRSSCPLPPLRKPLPPPAVRGALPSLGSSGQENMAAGLRESRPLCGPVCQ
ncbi:ankyrin repeat domain-containing protein 60 [Ctenodactylus gundi]